MEFTFYLIIKYVKSLSHPQKIVNFISHDLPNHPYVKQFWERGLPTIKGRTRVEHCRLELMNDEAYPSTIFPIVRRLCLTVFIHCSEGVGANQLSPCIVVYESRIIQSCVYTVILH